MSTSRPRRGRDFLVLAFAVQVRNQLGEAGCADPVTVGNSFTIGRNCFTKQTFPLTLAWVFGPGIIRAATNVARWVHRSGFSLKFLVRAQKMVFVWLDSA